MSIYNQRIPPGIDYSEFDKMLATEISVFGFQFLADQQKNQNLTHNRNGQNSNTTNDERNI